MIIVNFFILTHTGDGKLSQKEFLHVMKNWKIRGMKVAKKSNMFVLSLIFLHNR